MGFTVEDYVAENLKAVSFDALIREFCEVEKRSRVAAELLGKALEDNALHTAFALASEMGVYKCQSLLIQREAVRRDVEDGELTPEEFMASLGVVADILEEQEQGGEHND